MHLLLLAILIVVIRIGERYIARVIFIFKEFSIRALLIENLGRSQRIRTKKKFIQLYNVIPEKIYLLVSRLMICNNFGIEYKNSYNNDL